MITRLLYKTISNSIKKSQITILTGQFGTGKTTTLKYIYESIPLNNKIILNLENNTYQKLFSTKSTTPLISFLENKKLNLKKELYLLLDNTHKIKNISHLLNKLAQTDNIKLILTSAINTHLLPLFETNKPEWFEIYPFTFFEYLELKGVNHERKPKWKDRYFNEEQYLSLFSYYNEYLTFGGLPKVIKEENCNKKLNLLEEILTKNIENTFREYFNLKDISSLQTLLTQLALSISTKINITNLSQICGITRPTILQYLRNMENANIILPQHNTENYSHPNIYFTDNGMLNIIADTNEIQKYENSIFNQIRIDKQLSSKYNSKIVLESKLIPTQSDYIKLKQFAEEINSKEFYLIGKTPSLSFKNFIWGGNI